MAVLPQGLRGLVMAAMVSVSLSAADGFLNSAAVALVGDVWVPLCRRTPSDGAQLRLMRLVTVLTDMPLKAEKPIQEPKCGSCEICKNVCPAHAITGKLYEYGAPRSTIFDAKRCSEHMKTYKDIGRGAVCGLCMRACPYNQRKSSTKEETSLD
jgi:ferredoxin